VLGDAGLPSKGERSVGAALVRLPERTGMSDRTIRTGLKELDDPEGLAPNCQRRAGGGRKSYRAEQPGLREAISRLIEAVSRGSPMGPVRWLYIRQLIFAQKILIRGQLPIPSQPRR